MYSVEPFYPSDIFALDLANLDSATENYAFEYYLHYLLNHSDDCYKICAAEAIESQFLYTRAVLAYLIGKHETEAEFHAHVTALTVSPQYRRSGLGTQLMDMLRENGIQNGARFIDLFVRASNEKAIRFYSRLGYVVYRTVVHYYASPVENAYDMRLYLQ